MALGILLEDRALDSVGEEGTKMRVAIASERRGSPAAYIPVYSIYRPKEMLKLALSTISELLLEKK